MLDLEKSLVWMLDLGKSLEVSKNVGMADKDEDASKHWRRYRDCQASSQR